MKRYNKGNREFVLFIKVIIQVWQRVSLLFFNVNMFLKSVSTSKSRVTYDLDTNRVTYDLDTDTITHKIIGVVGSPLYLATPVSTALPKSHLSL